MSQKTIRNALHSSGTGLKKITQLTNRSLLFEVLKSL